MSALADGEATGEGEAPATIGVVVAAGAADAAGVGVGDIFAIIAGDFTGDGEGVGVPFWFFLLVFPGAFVGEAGGAGGGVTTATFGTSTC